MLKALQRLQSYFKSQNKPEKTSETAESYRVYTKEFDVVIHSYELDGVLGRLKPEDKAQLAESWETFLHAVQGWRTRATVNALEATSRIRSMKTAEDLQDMVVTILIDQSGSMKGQNMLLTAAACEIAQEFLVHLGIATEVLGFTTLQWQGGKSRKLWKSRESPPSPGRLNDLLHIIYRSALEKHPLVGGYRFMPMLRPDLLKENIDGEAIEWAVERLSAVAKREKTLIVLSDGAPVDDSTLYHNDKHILDRHLREVIGRIEMTGEIQLVGVGIGFDTAVYYRNAHQLSSIDDLGTVLISVLESAICGEKRSDAKRTGPSEEGKNTGMMEA